MNRTAGPAGGAWCRPDADSACAVVCRSREAALLGPHRGLQILALGWVVGVGVHSAGGPGAAGVGRGSGRCLRGGTFGRRVC